MHVSASRCTQLFLEQKLSQVCELQHEYCVSLILSDVLLRYCLCSRQCELKVMS